jgi:hypothetical protein
VIPVRTGEYIRADNTDYRVFSGTVDRDVRGTDGRLAIRRGSDVELIARRARDNDLILDLDSIMVNGQRYAIDTDTQRVDARDGIGANRRTGEFVGGGAILGSIIGNRRRGGSGRGCRWASADTGASYLCSRGIPSHLPSGTPFEPRGDGSGSYA